MSGLSASELQVLHGELLGTPPYSDAVCADTLYSALVNRQPPIAVTVKTVRYWWSKYRLPEGAETVCSSEELEERYGDVIRHLALEYPTAYKLCKALRARDPPLCITNKVAEVWLRKYARHGELRYVENAGHLETLCGERIRADAPPDVSSDGLAAWLLRELSVSVTVRVCQKFLTTTWSSSGRILTPDALEEASGERLRLQEYSDKFSTDALAESLATVLAESQPPLQVSALI